MRPETVCEVREPLAVYIRWWIATDIPAVAELNQRCGGTLDKAEILRFRRDERDVIGMVAEHDHKVCGVMLYRLHDFDLELLHFMVHPAVRRRAVGTQMMERLCAKTLIHQNCREAVNVIVSDRDTTAHLFLRHCNFRCESVVRRHFDDGSDGYAFVWRRTPKNETRTE